MTCRFAIVGWSDGGIVALLTAIHHPEAVTKVCHLHLYLVIFVIAPCFFLQFVKKKHARNPRTLKNSMKAKKSQILQRVVGAIEIENKWTKFNLSKNMQKIQESKKIIVL